MKSGRSPTASRPTAAPFTRRAPLPPKNDGERTHLHLCSSSRRHFPRANRASGDLMKDDLVSTEKAAARLHVSPRTLEKWRVTGFGPPYYKVGRLVLYSLHELDEWIDRGRRLPSSEPGEPPDRDVPGVGEPAEADGAPG